MSRATNRGRNVRREAARGGVNRSKPRGYAAWYGVAGATQHCSCTRVRSAVALLQAPLAGTAQYVHVNAWAMSGAVYCAVW